jgi:hypothetical protein
MSRTPVLPRLIAIGLVTSVLAACSTAVGGAPSPSAPASPVAPPSIPVASPQPTAPATPTAPVAPSDAPTPTPEPVVVVRIGTGTIARVTADGVAVRVLPGLDHPLIHGYHFVDGTDVEEVRLDAGDRVSVIWGPVLVDGHTWYSVMHVETAEPIIFDEGWISADFLAEEGPMPQPRTVLTADGLGSGKAVSGEVTDFSPLYVNVVAAPMPGDVSCEAEVILIGTDGVAITIGSSEVTESTHFFSSPLENDALFQDAAGKVVLQVRSDCSWAGMAWIPAG